MRTAPQPRPAAAVGSGSTHSGTQAGNQEVELEFWRAIKDGTDPDDFELYVQQFPTGIYAALAKRKIAKLRGAATDDETSAESKKQERKEAEEAARKEAEARAKLADEKEKLELELAKKEEEFRQREAQREAEARARAEAAEKAQQEAAAERERAKQEADRAKQEAAAELAKREAEYKKREAEAGEKARQRSGKAKQEAAAAAEKAKQEAEKAKKESEAAAKKQAEERAKREAEFKKREAELKAQAAAGGKKTSPALLAGVAIAVLAIAGTGYYFFAPDDAAQRQQIAEMQKQLEAAKQQAAELEKAKKREEEGRLALERARQAEAEAKKSGDKAKEKELAEARARAEAEQKKMADATKAREAEAKKVGRRGETGPGEGFGARTGRRTRRRRPSGRLRTKPLPRGLRRKRPRRRKPRCERAAAAEKAAQERIAAAEKAAADAAVRAAAAEKAAAEKTKLAARGPRRQRSPVRAGRGARAAGQGQRRGQALCAIRALGQRQGCETPRRYLRQGPRRRVARLRRVAQVVQRRARAWRGSAAAEEPLARGTADPGCMAITVKIMKRTPDGRPALYATRDFDVLPVSIGRDAACSICLEDPHKHMSRFHAEIQQEDGTYWLAVVSKVNPVMAEGRRYGPGTRLSLHSGDLFELAEYEVQVMLPEPLPAMEKAAATLPPSADALIPELASTQIHGTPPLDHPGRLFNESTSFGSAKALPPRRRRPRTECPTRCGWCSTAPACRPGSFRSPRANECFATAARSCARPSRAS